MTRTLLLFAAAAALAALALAAPSPAHAQDSQFGIRGLGTPGRFESVRARATGGAFAAFDPFSPLLEASIADVRRVTAGVTGGTSWRTVDFGTQSNTLRATRFPAFVTPADTRRTSARDASSSGENGSKGAKAPPVLRARTLSQRPGVPSPRMPNCESWARTDDASASAPRVARRGERRVMGSRRRSAGRR